jgi:hypothetical protein
LRSYRFSKVEYEASSVPNKLFVNKGGANNQDLKPIPLISFLSIETQQFFNVKQQNTITTLEKMQTTVSNYSNVINFFEEIDEDGSGVLEFPEFSHLLKKLGVEISDKRLNQLMKKYDIDNSGTIDRSEFLLFMKNQRKECVERLRDMRCTPMMMEGGGGSDLTTALDTAINDHHHSFSLSGTNTNNRSGSFHYLPPETGVFHLTVINHCSNSTANNTDTKGGAGQDVFSNSFTKSNNPFQMLHHDPKAAKEEKKEDDKESVHHHNRYTITSVLPSAHDGDEDDGNYNYRILTSFQCDQLVKLIRQLGTCPNLIALISSTISIVKLRFTEAVVLADIMLMETSDKIIVSEKVLLHMNDSNDTGHFLHTIFGENRQEVMRFKWEYGFLLKPLLGCPNGFYILDLSKDSHRKCFFKLLEINNHESERRTKTFQKLLDKDKDNNDDKDYHLFHLEDLSQMGNFFCFRNELFNGQPFTFTARFIHSLPTTGKLEFDFTSSERPPKDCLIINDRKYLKLLHQYGLLTLQDLPMALWKLEERKERNKESLSCKGYDYEFLNTPERASGIGKSQDEFYHHLSVRAGQYIETKDRICRPVEDGHQCLVRDISIPLPDNGESNANTAMDANNTPGVNHGKHSTMKDSNHGKQQQQHDRKSSVTTTTPAKKQSQQHQSSPSLGNSSEQPTMVLQDHSILKDAQFQLFESFVKKKLNGDPSFSEKESTLETAKEPDEPSFKNTKARPNSTKYKQEQPSPQPKQIFANGNVEQFLQEDENHQDRHAIIQNLKGIFHDADNASTMKDKTRTTHQTRKANRIETMHKEMEKGNNNKQIHNESMSEKDGIHMASDDKNSSIPDMK